MSRRKDLARGTRVSIGRLVSLGIPPPPAPPRRYAGGGVIIAQHPSEYNSTRPRALFQPSQKNTSPSNQH